MHLVPQTTLEINNVLLIGTIHIHHHVVKENNKDREFVVTQIYKTKL